MADATGALDATVERSVDLPRLADYLVGAGVALQGALNVELLAGGRSNPTYRLFDENNDWVLRRPPYGQLLRAAHDMGREVRVISALAGSAVPVPSVVAYCPDDSVLGAPFYVMERLSGRTFRTQDDTRELDATQRAAIAEQMIDVLVALHEIDPAQVGLADWGRPDGYLERQVARWSRQWQAVSLTERPEVERLVGWLTSTMPRTRYPGIVHGDYKIDNVLVANDAPQIVGVLDWEMSTLGDTLADVGILVSFWDDLGEFYNPITNGATAHEGFPTSEQVVQMYAARRGVEVDDLGWYVVLADFKVAVVLEQIHARFVRGETVGDGFEDIGGMVGPLLNRALERAFALR